MKCIIYSSNLQTFGNLNFPQISDFLLQSLWFQLCLICSPNLNFLKPYSTVFFLIRCNWESPFYFSELSHLTWESPVFQIFNQFLNYLTRCQRTLFNVPSNDYWLLVNPYSNCFSPQGIVLLGEIVSCSMFWDQKHLKMH